MHYLSLFPLSEAKLIHIYHKLLKCYSTSTNAGFLLAWIYFQYGRKTKVRSLTGWNKLYVTEHRHFCMWKVPLKKLVKNYLGSKYTKKVYHQNISKQNFLLPRAIVRLISLLFPIYFKFLDLNYPSNLFSYIPASYKFSIFIFLLYFLSGFLMTWWLM